MVSIPDIKTLYQSDKVVHDKRDAEKFRLFSSMTWGIIAFNIFALAILAGSLIYAKNYQNVLLSREAMMLQRQAEVYAETIVENAIQKNNFENPNKKLVLDKEKISLMLLRFASRRNYRIVLFDEKNNVIVDSHNLADHEKHTKPDYLDSYDKKEQPYILHIMKSLKNKRAANAWVPVSDNNYHVHAGYPIFHKDTKLGAILISGNADFMQSVTHAMRFEILVVFMGTLCFTIILSIYFSRQLAKPLRQLSDYADKVRQNITMAKEPPKLSNRDDEIGDLAIALADMTNSLRFRMEAIEQFAADVSHELKNPLTSIRSAIETLPKVSDNQKRNQLHDIIEHDLWRMDRLITDISKASRLDAQLIKEMMEPFDLKLVLRENIPVQNGTIERLINEGKIKATKIALHFLDASSKDKVIINGLPHRLIQVFDNVVINAASFSPDNSSITITLMCDEEYAMIIVDDEGPGIPEEKFDKIFDRFYTDRPRGNGMASNSSGLGLNISKQIVEAHKGTIWAENRDDGSGEVDGARFIILLPVIRNHGE